MLCLSRDAPFLGRLSSSHAHLLQGTLASRGANEAQILRR
ncbi:hypothetical protein ACRE_011540 [Hapsidospora chrysogenum ATCC 11550]|uniref:Uncharacterized protein n=1 Tax=Hapsidospora chrysogenum (strain ATCC 11550 / CBS 779.69 / DSM 880 / IAM 14645 / JCM 23072 / IMI 49137) TaxID=857340 RepID=A0A086TF49_HAPC1|nr:hypothetical protein ACRE_011540 [Hapsidospora chrysogenum ATCC 11550]